MLIHAESRHFDGEDPEVFFACSAWVEQIFSRFDIEELAFEEPLRTNSTIASRDTLAGPDGPEEVTTNKFVGNMRTFLRLYGIRGCVLAALQKEAKRRVASDQPPLRFREVNVRSWRSKVYGKVSPPATASNRSAWWKEQALNHCRLLNWPVTQKDAAEGAMIAEYLRIKRKEERFGITARPGEPDLFEPKKTAKEMPF
jgi:hypothetical protein